MNPRLPPRWLRARYPLAAALCTATTLAALPLRQLLDVANTDMLFLLTVFVIAVWLGRGPAVLAAFLCVALFDFFFVPPYYSFAVADAQYLVTFAVMLAVGLITSQLAARLAERTAQAQAREAETRLLYELARDLGAALTPEQAAAIIATFLARLDLTPTLLVAAAAPDASLFQRYGPGVLTPLEQSCARSAYERRCVIEADTLAGTGVAVVFLPLHAANRVLGVLAIAPHSDDAARLRAMRPLLEAVASLAAMLVERLQSAAAAQHSATLVSTERLRTSILASLSHDLRTPLTSLVGLADTLVQQQPPLPESARDTARIIRDQAHAMHRMLSNLLDMARLNAGTPLHLEWQPFEEIVGSSTRLMAGVLAAHPLAIDVPRDLPLLHFDAVLLERVLYNLLENAAKYSPAGARIGLTAQVRGAMLEVVVDNDGPGFPPTRLAQMFELFVRGTPEAAIAGAGMGLAICKAIVAAHGGEIHAENRTGGACVRFTLPLGTPPALVEEDGA